MKPEQLSGLSILITKGFMNWVCYRRSRSGNQNYQEDGASLKNNSSPIAENELVLLLATLIGGGMNNEWEP